MSRKVYRRPLQFMVLRIPLGLSAPGATWWNAVAGGWLVWLWGKVKRTHKHSCRTGRRQNTPEENLTLGARGSLGLSGGQNPGEHLLSGGWVRLDQIVRLEKGFIAHQNHPLFAFSAPGGLC